MNVLVLDDELQIRNGLKKFLLSLPLEFENVFSASSSDEALVIVKNNRVDIILVDIIMPGLDGISFCKKVREKSKEIQLIIVSGHSEMDYIKSAFKLSVSDYLFKPVDFQELRESVFKAARQTANANKPHTVNQCDKIEIIGADCKLSKYTDYALMQVQNRYYKLLTIQQISDELKITPNYFSATFKKDTSMSFSDYLLAYRMKKATFLLKDPTMNINEIAQMVGYDDQNYFSRSFKKQYQVSPSEYRQIHS